jgi:GT2 family glycosyltransferase
MNSIVIVNYNGGRRFIENLRVLCECLPTGFAEVIVVDNASTDGSPDAVEREASWVRLVRTGENRGYSAGVNAGIAKASGEVVVVMNPDAVPEPGALELLCSLTRERREFAILGGGVVSEDGRLSGTCFRALPGVRDILREGILFRTRQVPDRSVLESSTDEVLDGLAISQKINLLT